MKIRVSQAQSNWFALKKAPANKRRFHRFVHLRQEQVQLTSTTATHSDAVRVLSFLFIIAQIGTRNTEYLSSWLQKIRLQQLLFELGTFSEPLVFTDVTFWKELVCLIFKSLLPSLTSVNYEGAYLAEGFLHNLCPCFDIAFAQLGVIPKIRNKFVLKQQLLQNAN